MKRLFRLLFVLAGAGAAAAAALWLLRERVAGVEVEPVRDHASAPRFRVAEPNGSSPTADDLTEIVGIGPVYAQRLTAAGIATFAALAAATPSQLANATGAAAGTVETWIDQATELL